MAAIDRTSDHPFGTAARRALVAWLTARAVVGIAWLITSTSWFEGFSTSFSQRHRGLFLWDGTYYRELAAVGYEGTASEVQRFFPLYHLLGRWVGAVAGVVTSRGDEVGLLLVANVAAFVALWLMYLVVADLSGDERLASRSVWWLALFPAAPVLVWAYSESLGIALGLAAVWWYRRRWWWASALCGVGVGLTRSVGATLAVVFAVAALTDFGELRRLQRRWSLRDWVGRAAAILGPPAGFAAYFLWLRSEFGTWDHPLEAQRQFRDGWRDPLTRLVQAAIDVAGGSADDAFNLAFAVLVIAVLVLTWRRVPMAGWAYVAVTLIVVLAANNIDSLGRYVLAAFPLVALCAVAERRLAGDRSWVPWVVSSGSAAAMIVYCLWAWSGRMIP
ncbi:MAG: hypothetical protein R2689_10980 [Microthrixaceae bacterium]